LSEPRTWSLDVISINYRRKAQAQMLDIIFFTESIVNVWNSLPDEVDFNTVKSFTRNIKRVSFNDFTVVV